MYKNGKISFLDEPITSTDDLSKVIDKKMIGSNVSNLNNVAISNPDLQDLFTQLLRYELILHQKNFIPVLRPYTLEDMLKTKIYIEALDFLETIKYAEYVVNARKLLHKYLYSKYDINSCLILNTNKKLKKCMKLYASTSINVGNTYFPITTEPNQPSPSKSVRQHLNRFLLNRSTTSNMNTQCGLCFTSSSTVGELSISNMNDFDNLRIYLPVTEIPQFLLLFTYFDGRDFTQSNFQHNPDKLPSHKQRQQYSLDAYSNILKITQTLYPKPDVDSPLTLNTFYRCESIFLVQKINLLLWYYELYLSESMLNVIIKNYNLSYSQIMNLKSVISDSIFRDIEFIKTGLESPYPDFMIFFDIFYRYSIYVTAMMNSESNFDSFKEMIKNLKKRALLLMQTEITLTPFYPPFTFSQNGSLLVLNSEFSICEFLKSNPFFKIYYPEKANLYFTPETLKHSEFNFDIIKQVLSKYYQ